MQQTLGNTPANVPLARNNLAGAVDPTATDGASKGYDTNSMWVTAANNKVWICTDNTDGHATWHPLGVIAPLSNYGATVAPTATDDTSKGYSSGSMWVVPTGSTLLIGAYVCLKAIVGAAVWKKFT